MQFDNVLTIDQRVIDHQIELAEKAVEGDEDALKTIAANFGYWGGSGLSYWPDTDRAMVKARKILETRSID